MKSLELLEEEHRDMERALDLLETAVFKILRGESVDPKAITLLLRFFREYAFCHEEKIEKALFPLLESKNPPLRGLIAELKSEHALSRRALRTLQEIFEEEFKGVNHERGGLADALSYVRSRRLHMFKEGELFRTAREVLSEDDDKRLLEEFKEIESNILGPKVQEHPKQLTELLDEVEMLLSKAGGLEKRIYAKP